MFQIYLDFYSRSLKFLFQLFHFYTDFEAVKARFVKTYKVSKLKISNINFDF